MNRYIVLKYLKRLRLERFKEGRRHYNFKCPLPGCGDMQSYKSIGRGYVLGIDDEYPKYYCHNCSTRISFANFLKEINEVLYQEYLSEFKDHKFYDFVKNKKAFGLTI